jgi:hypothetical protein
MLVFEEPEELDDEDENFAKNKPGGIPPEKRFSYLPSATIFSTLKKRRQ